MGTLPSGTVTFLFTDIEGSTQLWEQHPESMKEALAKHDSILREAIESNNGYVIKTTGDGVHGVFEKAFDAIQATLSAQRNLKGPIHDIQIKVRMGLHTGEAELRASDYHGQVLNRAARLMAVGYGGQTLLSSITAELVREHLAADISLLDLGEHRLKDLVRPEHIFQLMAPDLPKEFPALKSLNALPNNLPSQLTSFIGREREMQEAKELLASARLLTLIGPGGTGKTRLSLQLAAEQLSEFRDGVWLTELAPLTDPTFIISTIATVLGLHEVPGVPLTTIVLDFLRAKQLLLILDNCEHLIEASAQIVDQLLHGCSELKIIASSREALGVNGETVYRVPSLSLPDLSSSSLMEYESTRLFIERAAKAEPRFHLTDHNVVAIAQICTRLDGIPLAIELAAARLKLFTPEQIAERLDDRFKLLTGGSRTALPRQQTLRALIDWSYQALNETEQRTLRRLAVFSGGWTFEAAEEVVGEADTLEGLSGLVNKSLVNVDEQHGESRYRFLETIRQYAMEKLLESGEAIETRNHHFDTMLRLAAVSENKMFGSESTEWLDQMETEHDNLRAAFEWSIANYPEKGIKLAQALGGFWTSRDYNSEAQMSCRALLMRTETLPNLDSERANIYALLGWNCITIGDHKAGRTAAERALELARRVNDAKTLVRADAILSLSSMFLGDFVTAEKAVTEGETLARQHGFAGELALVLSVHAQATFFGERDITRTKAYLEESVSIAEQAGYRFSNSIDAYGLARVAAAMGDLETARAKFLESERIAKGFGNKRIVYSSRSELAHALREHGEIEEPLGIYRELLPRWKDLGHRAAVAHELECIAFILAKKKQPQRAVMLLGASDALRKMIDTAPTVPEQAEYEKEVSIMHAEMDEAEFKKAWEEGQRLSMDDAIALAIQED
ncbi:MAG TPA: adenylate/guanylate cyclase domain-containing protein [Anaerolineales bacterium]|nr:adenylate/guanylate cyclase domain-containing protein [Anaerolineales bacterium]HLO33899.1 adenylate/guanylate cyclase domain-containing protein [Anaerolineales bacterium]